LTQSGEMPGPEHLWLEAPGPVTVGPAGMIHPGLTAQHEHILERHDHGIGDRAHSGADHVIGNVLAAACQIALSERALLRRRRPKPADGGIVVVGTGVHHTIGPIEVWYKAIAR